MFEKEKREFLGDFYYGPLIEDEFIMVSVPRIGLLLEEVFKEFEWDMDQGPHPVQTGNCDPSQHRQARGGDAEEGYAVNAAWSCQHCYPGSNPAKLIWTKDRVWLGTTKESSKPGRLLVLARKIQPEPSDVDWEFQGEW